MPSVVEPGRRIWFVTPDGLGHFEVRMEEGEGGRGRLNIRSLSDVGKLQLSICPVVSNVIAVEMVD